ncbi:uncharacterized protein [Fopius arisanus]|uniref:Uncharacterized protein isoform X1 n=2 Tax=Fopius arisanus TaxID=64838 RepID=A0A9R1U5V0_9HYME|nr:PREDICTED: uncharacterized protein LOC105269560 isoform X1 [Fopius arisanus]
MTNNWNNSEKIGGNGDCQLLVANKIPIEVYLDGFEVLDFLRTAGLVHSYGGKVTPPNERTLILSRPDRPRGSQWLKFDIRWLYDSIKFNRRQDIGKYLISPVIPRRKPRSQVLQLLNSNRREHHKEQSNETPKEDVPEQHLNSSVLVGSPSYSFLGDKPLNLSPEVHKNQTPTLQSVEVTPALGKMNNDKKVMTSSSNLENNSMNNSCWRFPGHLADVEKIPVAGLDNNYVGTKDFLKSWIHQRSEVEGQKDLQIMQEGESSGSALLEKKSMGNAKDNESLRIVRFTFEDDQKIVKYLIDKKAILRIQGPSIWFEMAYDKILPNRDASTLRFRFEEKLLAHIDQYTDDPTALKQFRAFKPGTQNSMDLN